MSSTTPNAPPDVPQPSSMSTHEQSTPGADMTQVEQFIENQQDVETPDVTEDTGIEPSFGSKNIERPVLPPALREGYDDGRGDGTTTKILASEIPDSDAISPFTSPMKEVRGQEFAEGGDGAVDTAGDRVSHVMAAVVEGEESEGKATTNRIGETTMIDLPRASEVSVYARLRLDAESNERDRGDGPSLPTMQIADLQELPIFGPQFIPESGHISAQQAVLLQSYTRAEGGSFVQEAPEPTSVEIQQAAACKDGGLNDDRGSPTPEVAYHESPPSDEVDVVVAETSLPTEKASFLQTALQADKALSLEDASTLEDTQLTNDMSSTKELPRTEIPASDDDEDPMDEITDASTNIFELHTSYESSAEYHDTFSMELQTMKAETESFLCPSSTAKAEPRMNGTASSAKDQDFEMVDKPTTNTEATETFNVSIPVAEYLVPRISADERISGSLDVDVPEAVPVEGDFSTLIEFPTNSVNLQYPIQADARNSLAAMEVDLPDVPVSTKEGVRLNEAPASPIHHLGASIIVPSPTASAESPKIEPSSSKFTDEELPEITASSSIIQTFPPAEEMRASLMCSLPQNADDGRTSEISSSPPKFKAGKHAPAKLTSTPDASFGAADGSQIKETGSFITLKPPSKRKTSSTAPNESQGQTKRQSIPKKMADTANTSLTALVEAPNNDVLFQELKTMKIASIQARTLSLEAEIASRRAKLEVLTQELQNPAAETVKRHIKLLHDYNDIRDVGQGLVGMIADNRGVRIGELYDEFGVGLKD